jgi:uncharacterized membrane protein YbaN (DUF454 family)
MRPLYFTLGWVFFGVGFAGAFVPVLPTTPFMLLALWSFSRSSPRFHDWLYNHKFFGPPLQQWHEHHVIPPVAKFFALFFMCVAIIYLYFFSTIAIWIKLAAGAIIAYGAWFILSKPSRPPAQQQTTLNEKRGENP